MNEWVKAIPTIGAVFMWSVLNGLEVVAGKEPSFDSCLWAVQQHKTRLHPDAFLNLIKTYPYEYPPSTAQEAAVVKKGGARGEVHPNA